MLHGSARLPRVRPLVSLPTTVHAWGVKQTHDIVSAVCGHILRVNSWLLRLVALLAVTSGIPSGDATLNGSTKSGASGSGGVTGTGMWRRKPDPGTAVSKA
eukprot:365390-Chlamydomonas_euryale.AAC.9